eukprot:CAMPEP_0185901414 /NCGR_PEP_ID=MMETSP0196C-20130402/771_1 /TAXON_ID=2932 /ORGANISM="Alexandrium fundyense, Strain CCMP1719" /LENGTH=53 /DNA_ID=CAMNT_0028620061 /DNA_START=37 /DNA_END=194 /DNA_ORIENTATION=+
MTPARVGCYYSFTSTQFSEPLAERRVDSLTGVTQENDDLLCDILVGALHDGQR